MKREYLIYSLFVCLLAWSCSNDMNSNNKSKNDLPKSVQTSNKNKVEAPPTDPVPPEQLAKAKELLAAKYDDLDGKAIFKRNCASCHGFKGKLKIGGAKKLSISEISIEETVAQIYFGRGSMLPYSKLLSDAEIVAVAKYAKGLRR